MIVVDETKVVSRLGACSPVPVEVVPFGWEATARRLQRLAARLARRASPGGPPLVTDGRHYILDCAFGGIEDPESLQRQLDGTVGVVEHGLFLGLVTRVIVGGPQGVRVVDRPRPG